ncbi:putative sec20-domain-containing protein [Lyophyllum shimeji]|uniref:Sec20-domain-containing protein n=1 Tax=Lyophyllum shimeji TaxID=47721 RepID=A0A9P3PT69_LYOSH|nr:putative sec20-domain-containing protein [Lyophyllum shimeji]
MPPVTSTFSEDTHRLISAAKRRQADLMEYQIPRLRACTGPLSLQQNLAAELREDIDSFARQVEALDLSVGDQRGEKCRMELSRIVDELRDRLAQLRRDSRVALLTSKRAIDSQSKSRREELLSSSAATEKGSVNEKVTDDALMKANDNVTEALRRTIGLMQGELERSVLSTQMLDASTASLRATSSTHDTLTNLMGTSKQLITALEKSDWIDRILIIAAFVFFVLVVLFILKQRILDRGLRVALWWTRFLPNLSREAAMVNIEKGSAKLSSAVASLSSTVVAASSVAASVAARATAPVIPREDGATSAESSSTLDSLYSDVLSATPPPADPTIAAAAPDERTLEEPRKVVDEL